ncbi:hypothetical protein TNCV_912601 [Trichonephila clavipes]|nr:hypothetical protein TNCV_912601 [Trichonephila clavipes]
MYKLGGEVENIVGHNYIGKHGWREIGGTVHELARLACVISTFQTWTACDEHAFLYECWVGVHPLPLRPNQQNWTCFCLVIYEKISKRGSNRIIKRLLRCIRPWRNMNLSESRLMTHLSILKWTLWHIYPMLLLQFVKPPVFLNMSANPCHVSVVHAYMPMAAISNTS